MPKVDEESSSAEYSSHGGYSVGKEMKNMSFSDIASRYECSDIIGSDDIPEEEELESTSRSIPVTPKMNNPFMV